MQGVKRGAFLGAFSPQLAAASHLRLNRRRAKLKPQQAFFCVSTWEWRPAFPAWHAGGQRFESAWLHLIHRAPGPSAGLFLACHGLGRVALDRDVLQPTPQGHRTNAGLVHRVQPSPSIRCYGFETFIPLRDAGLGSRERGCRYQAHAMNTLALIRAQILKAQRLHQAQLASVSKSWAPIF